MKRFGLAASLVLIWVFLWGRASVANLVSGLAVSVALLIAFPGDSEGAPDRHLLRPLGVLRLVWYFVRQLVSSNVLLAREVLARRARLRTAVVAVPLQTRSPALITAMTNIMALNPGTLVIELDERADLLFVHVFYLRDLDVIRDALDELQQLMIAAFPERGGPTPGPDPSAVTS